MDDESDRLVQTGLIDARARGEGTSVEIAVHLRGNVVAEPLGLTDIQEHARTHVSTQDDREQLVRKMIAVQGTDTGNAQHQMRLIHFPRKSEDEIIGRVELFFMMEKIRGLDGLDHLLGADGIPAKRMIAVQELLEIPPGAVHGRVLVHALLLHDHPTLLLDLLLRKLGVAEHVAEHITRKIQVLRRGLHVIPRVLLAGECIEVAAHPLDRSAHILRRQILITTLEEHVLQKVADAAILLPLAARPRSGEHHDRGGFHTVAGSGENRQPGGKTLNGVHRGRVYGGTSVKQSCIGIASNIQKQNSKRRRGAPSGVKGKALPRSGMPTSRLRSLGGASEEAQGLSGVGIGAPAFCPPERTVVRYGRGSTFVATKAERERKYEHQFGTRLTP